MVEVAFDHGRGLRQIAAYLFCGNVREGNKAAGIDVGTPSGLERTMYSVDIGDTSWPNKLAYW